MVRWEERSEEVGGGEDSVTETLAQCGNDVV